MPINSLFNSRGQWIAFRLSNKLFDTEGRWIGWFPQDNHDAFTPQGSYLGTVLPDETHRENRFYFLEAHAQRVCPEYAGIPGYRVRNAYDSHRTFSPLPPGAEDVAI